MDPAFNDHFRSRTGFFGSFECTDDREAAVSIIGAAGTWLAGRGARAIRGPINPVAECWGALVDGFSAPPVYMSPYNPPYYDSALSAAGLLKARDLLAYEADADTGYRIPERFVRFASTYAARNPSISLRRIDLSAVGRDAEHIRRILNAGVAGNWGFVPVGEAEMAAIANDLKPVLDPDAVWLVEDGGRPVGCCLGFPDINVILRRIHGRLFPTGFIALAFGIRTLRDYRLWGLAVLPEYRGRGLDVLLYCALSRALSPRRVRLEANYVLEDNLMIRNALEKLGMKQVKRYRVYEKALVVGAAG